MPKHSFNLNLAVGSFVLLVAVLVGGFLFLYGDWESRSFDHFTVRVRFRAISNLRAGSPVKLSGRPVGVVDSIYTSGNATDGRYHVAVVQISDRPEYRDAIRTDSIFRIETDGVLGDQHLAITFGTDAGDPLGDDTFVWGDAPVEIATILADLQTTVAAASTVMKSLELGLTGPTGDARPFARFLDDLRSSTENLARITASIERLLGPGDLENGQAASVQEILLDLKRTTHNALLITHALRTTFAGEGDESPDLRQLLLNLERTSLNTAEATESLKQIMGSDESGEPVDIRQTLKDIEASASNLRSITIEIQGILAGIKKLNPGNWFK